jgi:hypothetical protein
MRSTGISQLIVGLLQKLRARSSTGLTRVALIARHSQIKGLPEELRGPGRTCWSGEEGRLPDHFEQCGRKAVGLCSASLSCERTASKVGAMPGRATPETGRPPQSPLRTTRPSRHGPPRHWLLSNPPQSFGSLSTRPAKSLAAASASATVTTSRDPINPWV